MEQLCECGCGNPAPLAKKTNRTLGHIKGQPLRYIAGHNTPTPAKDPTKRFWPKVDRRGLDDCWEWQGARVTDGYGYLLGGKADPQGRRWVLTHRLSWEIHNGPIPEDRKVLHTCDNPPCVNPLHLYLGTHAENARDRAVRKRGKEQRQHGEANDNARLSEAQVLEIDSGLQQGVSQSELARRFGISQVTVHRIAKRTTWRHLWG